MSERGCVVVWTLCTVFMAKVLVAVLELLAVRLLAMLGRQTVTQERYQTHQGPPKQRQHCRA